MSSLHVALSFLAAKIVILVLFHFESVCSSEPPGDPTVSCWTYVTEGQSTTCDCQARFLGNFPPDFSLTWPRYSNNSSLQLTNVKRKENGTVFTCLMIWDGHKRMANYTLQVAYGPDDAHTIIQGPSTFVTDGTKSLTLTCTATEVHPPPLYTWDTDKCEKEDMKAGTCTFTPDPLLDDGRHVLCAAKSQAGGNNKGTAVFSLNLTYPPREPPTISGITPGERISFGSQLRCSVTGGKPPVSKIIFTCLSLDLKYSNFTHREEGTVSSSLIIDKASEDTNNRVQCTCRAVWEPQEDLYTLTSQVLLQIQVCEDVQNKGNVGLIVGLIICILIGITSTVLMTYMWFKEKKRKHRSKKRADSEEKEKEVTYNPLTSTVTQA